MPPIEKREFQAFLGVVHYLSKLSPSRVDICKSLRKLTSAKTEWAWNATCQKILNKAKSVIKEDAYINFYDETKPLFLEMEASGVGVGAALLQTRSGNSCPRDKVPATGHTDPWHLWARACEAWERYSNIEREVVGILYGLIKFHHHCFAREVSIITDHKLLVVIFKKDVATLSQRLK